MTKDQAMATDAREDKLPAWAKLLVMNLRNTIRDQETALAIAHGAAADAGCTGKIMADCLGKIGFPLHDRAIVEFHIPGGKVMCNLRDNGTKLYVNATGSVRIHPGASNAFIVTLGD
jgi:hypothetical protein